MSHRSRAYPSAAHARERARNGGRAVVRAGGREPAQHDPARGMKLHVLDVTLPSSAAKGFPSTLAGPWLRCSWLDPVWRPVPGCPLGGRRFSRSCFDGAKPSRDTLGCGVSRDMRLRACTRCRKGAWRAGADPLRCRDLATVKVESMAWLGIWFEYLAGEGGARSPEHFKGLAPPHRLPVRARLHRRRGKAPPSVAGPRHVLEGRQRYNVYYSLAHDGGQTAWTSRAAGSSTGSSAISRSTPAARSARASARSPWCSMRRIPPGPPRWATHSPS